VATATLNVIFPGAGTTIMALAIMISTFGCNNGLILAGARAYYAMARDGLFFHFPNITIEVARECSGIHSTIVLFIICVVAGQFFLQNPRHRLLLVGVAVPLGIIRNAFRIWLISWLCVHFGPEMIKSPIHRRGGPVFFALSIVPLVLLIIALRRRENRKGVLQARRRCPA
jgi:exosortase/archaeosortase family protein